MLIDLPLETALTGLAALWGGLALFVALVQATLQRRRLQQLRKEVVELRREREWDAPSESAGIGGIGLVHYDAFGDASGRLSFSAAVLDHRGEGIVLTTINGRAVTRTYAKPVRERDPARLSAQEREAVLRASTGPREPAQQHKRVRRAQRDRPSAVTVRSSW